MATKKGTVKKTVLTEYSRPKQGGIIAIRLKEGDELVDVVIVGPGDDVLLSTAVGMAIRFPHTDARPMGRATEGVRGIRLTKDDVVVGIVVAKPEMFLLSVCEHGYGKRTPFGVAAEVESTEVAAVAPDAVDAVAETPEVTDEVEATDAPEVEAEDAEVEEDARSGFQYRRQGRGGKGVRDIKTTSRNGKVVDVLAVQDGDHVVMVTSGGMLQRVRVADISVVGRNTQGVRIIRLDKGKEDALVSLARIPAEIVEDEAVVDVPESLVTPETPAEGGTEPTSPEATPES
jgi:DNA gyrase subunit A